MSERTLAGRLAEEGVTFIEVLQQLKATLAGRYLEDDGMPISRIAWLLGFEDASSFSHADGGRASRHESYGVWKERSRSSQFSESHPPLC